MFAMTIHFGCVKAINSLSLLIFNLMDKKKLYNFVLLLLLYFSVDQIITSLVDIFHQSGDREQNWSFGYQLLITCTSLLIQLDQLVCSPNKPKNFMGGSRVGEGGPHTAPSPHLLENHKWLKISLEIIVWTPLKGGSYGPL